jgi:ParB family transcriptional regulator, chromosome partitioning protein
VIFDVKEIENVGIFENQGRPDVASAVQGSQLAPFIKRDSQLVPAAGSCVDCPKRTGHNKLLFVELSGGLDACTDPNCHAAKLEAHVKAKIAAKPELVQISTAYKQQLEGEKAIARNKYVEIREEKPDTPEKAKWP